MIRTLVYSILMQLSKLSSQRYVSVLAYHSIESKESHFNVTPAEFARQIEYLRKNYSIVSLEEVCEFVAGTRDLPRKAVAITFDDGYYDNYVNVYSYAKKYRLPFAIFVASGYIGKEMLIGDVPLKMLGWRELTEMSRDNVTIGAHTVTHVDLQRVDISEATSQIAKSKADIEEGIGQPICFFAYPFGEYDDTLAHLLKSAGFMAGFKTYPDGLIVQGNNPFLLNRVEINSSVNFTMFKAKLTLAAEWYRAIERTRVAVCKLPSFIRKVGSSECDVC